MKAGFHEGREITYLQEINYLQEIQKYNKKEIQVILAARLHTSKFQLILCFSIDLKELIRIQQFLPHGEDNLFDSRENCSQTQFSHIINRLLTSLVRSVL
jgi:hypothetical protein